MTEQENAAIPRSTAVLLGVLAAAGAAASTQIVTGNAGLAFAALLAGLVIIPGLVDLVNRGELP